MGGLDVFDHVFDFHNTRTDANRRSVAIGGTPLFWIAKRFFDIALSLLLLPLFACFSVVLLVMNPVWNKGPLFFVQKRMGRNCQPFHAIKFRTMVHVAEILRGPEDPIEVHRITQLGHLLRSTRIDELPQILNVLKGDMSLLGPRPDYFEHARTYLDTVPGYRERYAVRPGISGLAQVSVGYVDSTEGTKLKTRADLHYIRNAGFAQDTLLVYQTIYTVVSRIGS